jgi:small subunit ribosomal protein S8
MSVHDTIGDFITVIRNAGKAGKTTCSYPHSKLRVGIAKILKSRGFVENCDEQSADNGHKNIQITLKYVDGEHAIRGINRYREIPRVLGGLGISILSTPSGIIDDKTARKNKLGGEVLCSVW